MQKPLITALTTLLLASCATTPTPQATQTARPDSIITIPTTTATSNATLEQQYGGTIALRTHTFAIIANPTRQPLTVQGGKQHSIEKNKDLVSIEPDAKSENVWSSGRAYAWNDSFSQGLPDNVQSWAQIGLQYAEQNSYNGAGQVIAVIDSGIDTSHPIFANRLTSPVSWFDFSENDTVPQEEGTLGQGAYGHGTFVSGIVTQIAPQAKIMPIRVLNSDGIGDILDVASAIVWATDNGATVINLSLGTANNSDALTLAIAYANSRKVVIAAAAGNSNKDGLDFPAQQFKDSKFNIAVGSVSKTDSKSKFSSYGESMGIMAPGENVQSVLPGNHVAILNGTSMSTPVVAAALALSLGREEKAEETIKLVLNSADNISNIEGNELFEDKLGYGRINIQKLLGGN
ncbi:S8 family peptidase [Deinococcus aquaticus]|uniref:S8 family serine peptidase n=1 Tax=Deinococcus aquaticus TaxID=328692 RepID=A0ABY7V4Y1_9DEIO|nr:S8 family serine peptidase [Deinococcus aquaticus]WDA60256.1 S8 family serine peptidase [Deinococcus aquaticus]